MGVQSIAKNYTGGSGRLSGAGNKQIDRIDNGVNYGYWLLSIKPDEEAAEGLIDAQIRETMHANFRAVKEYSEGKGDGKMDCKQTSHRQ